MKIRIEGVPSGLASSPVTHEVEYVRIDIGKDPNDLITVYRYVTPVPVARLEGVPNGIRLIGEYLHRLQYTHTDGGTDVYSYVESVSSPSDDYTRLLNDVLDQASAAYDGDEAAESIAITYVRDLEWIRDFSVAQLNALEKSTVHSSDVLHDFIVDSQKRILERARRTE